MAVPSGFFRNKNPNFNVRGALKIDAIFATDDGAGTEAFQGWLADNSVITKFNDALIQNRIGVNDTEGFNTIESNRFAYTSMSEGQKIVTKNLIRVKFSDDIDPTLGQFQSGQLLEFFSNGLPYGSVVPPSNGRSYKIFGIRKEKDIIIDSIGAYEAEGAGLVRVNTDVKENLQEFQAASNTGNNYREGDKVVIQGVTPATYNGTYTISSVNSTGFLINIASDPGAYQYGGSTFILSNELLLTEFVQAEASLVSFSAGDNTIDLSSSISSGSIVPGQQVVSSLGGLDPATFVLSYDTTNQLVTLTAAATGTVGNTVLNFSLDSPQEIVIPNGATVPSLQADGVTAQPQPFVQAGTVTDCDVIAIPSDYFIYGDARLYYFWAKYDNTSTLFNGWEQNVTGDTFTTLQGDGGVPTPQLLGDNFVFSQEDTFNNIFKTLGTVRGPTPNSNYTVQGRAALLYISATDSQGQTLGNTGNGNNRASVTSGYTVDDTVRYINDNNGYWIGIIGGSFDNTNNPCQNEIQTFRADSSDGIQGDPRGYIPILGAVETVRIGAPIESGTLAAGNWTINTYYDHRLSNASKQRVRWGRFISNTQSISTFSGDIVGTATGSVEEYFVTPIESGIVPSAPVVNEFGILQFKVTRDGAGNVTSIDLDGIGDGRGEKLQAGTTIELNNVESGQPLGGNITITVQASEITNETTKIRIKNATTGLFDRLTTCEVTGDKTIVVEENSFDASPLSAITNFDDNGYILGIEPFLTTPTGFYRKTTLEYFNSSLLRNDSRTLADPPGVGLDRKEILTTVQVTETDGELEFFSAYPVGDFFVGLPELGDGYPYIAYPVDNRSIKFKVDVFNSGLIDYIETSLQDNGGSLVTPKEEFGTVLYIPEFTADVTNAPSTTQIIVNNLQLFDNGEEGREFTILTSGGTGYEDNTTATTFSYVADTTATIGTGVGLTLNVQVTAGVVTSISTADNGSGYDPLDEVTVDAFPGGTTTTLATVRIKDILDDAASNFILEGFDDPGDGIAPFHTSGIQPEGFAPRTQTVSIVSGPGAGEYTIDFDKAYELNPVGNQIGFTFPQPIRRVNVFVKPSNNFKDVTVSDVDTDAFISFGGYGYTQQDVLTPSVVVNPPATVQDAFYTKDTTISLEGFESSGLSPVGNETFSKSLLAGSLSGVGANFNVTQTASGTYLVELVDGGADFVVEETITIPGYELGGSNVASFINVETATNTGGYTPGLNSNVTTTTTNSPTGGSGLIINFVANTDGTIDTKTIVIVDGGDNYEIGDTLTIDGSATPATAIVSTTENDLTITVTVIDDNSRITFITANSHNFVPPLGRNTVDIFVEDVVNTIASGPDAILSTSAYNGRFVAEVTSGTTLEVSFTNGNPGTYDSGGSIINISPDVVNDSFASFSSFLYFNINTPTLSPTYPYIKFISTTEVFPVGEPANTLRITTTDSHGLLVGDEVRISGIEATRDASSKWNSGKTEVTNVVDADTFDVVLPTLANNPIGNYIQGTGEITNPYVKVLGGVYTKDFFRIIFVNTDTTTQDGIPPDKTQDFLVRDINFKQISNDGNEVVDQDKHNFYIQNGTTLAIPRRVLDILSIEYPPNGTEPELLEYRVTCASPHGLYKGNAFVFNDLNLANLNETGVNIADYETPNNEIDRVTFVESDTVFRYIVFRTGRDPATDPQDLSWNGTGTGIGTIVKGIDGGGGTGFPNGVVFSGPTNAGNATEIIKFSGLQGIPGLDITKEYYVQFTDTLGGGSNDPENLLFRVSLEKNGSPEALELGIVSASYNVTDEVILIETSAPHFLNDGASIAINNISDAFNGEYTVDEVISSTIFTYSKPPVSGNPDVATNTTKSTIIGDPGSTEIKRVEGLAGSNFLQLRTNGQDIGLDGIAIGMVVTQFQGNQVTTALAGAAGPLVVTSISSTGFNIDDGTGTFTLANDLTQNNNRVQLDANVTGAKCLALDSLNEIVIGQGVSGTGIPAGTLVDGGPTDESTFGIRSFANYPALITITEALTANTGAGATITFTENQINQRAIRMTNVTGGAPLVGQEVLIHDLNGDPQLDLQSGTLVTQVEPYSGGFIVGIDTSIISTINVTSDIFKLYPETNPTFTGATVSGVFADFVGDVIQNQDTSFNGQVQITSDVSGWDHVTLAKETGGAIFFQLGFTEEATGSFGSNTITMANDISSELADANGGNAAGIGAYGEGLAPGATIVSVVGTTITLDRNNIADVDGYVGFARPNSVSVFPKYTEEFGRILGKTFAEWLFKIA